MSELIKRMRSYAPLGDGSMWSQPSKDYQLAADEIESLRAKVKELEDENGRLKIESGTWMLKAKCKPAPMADSVPIELLTAEQSKVKVLTDALDNVAWNRRPGDRRSPIALLKDCERIALEALATVKDMK